MTKDYSITVSFGKEKNKKKQTFNEYEIKEVIESFKEGLEEKELAILIGSNVEAITKLVNKLKLMKIISINLLPKKKILKPKKKIKRIRKKGVQK